MGRKLKSLIGNVYGNLTVIADSQKRSNRKVIWVCRCSCGSIIEVRSDALVTGNTKSCGCSKKTALTTTLTSPSTSPVKSRPIKPTKIKVSPQQTSPNITTSLSSFSQFVLDCSALFPKANFMLLPFNNNTETALVDKISNTAFLYIEPKKYNQETLIQNGICKTYAECKKYIKSLQDELIKLSYRTIVVYENEWQDKKHKISNFLRSVLNQNSITVFARKCTVKMIGKQDAVNFFSAEHIQGPAKISTHFYGLFDEDFNLISVVSFGKHHRNQSIFNKPDIAVLDRLAIKANYNIPGGSSKLLKFAENDLKKDKFKQIVSWSDNRISNGNLYIKLGFSLHGETPSDYSYYNVNESQKQNKCIIEGKQKNKKSCLGIQHLSITELEYTKQIGKYRIYDCGKKVWLKSI